MSNHGREDELEGAVFPKNWHSAPSAAWNDAPAAPVTAVCSDEVSVGDFTPQQYEALCLRRTATGYHAEPAEVSRRHNFKDHEIRQLVSDITLAAKTYAGAQCMRDVMSRIVMEFMKNDRA